MRWFFGCFRLGSLRLQRRIRRITPRQQYQSSLTSPALSYHSYADSQTSVQPDDGEIIYRLTRAEAVETLNQILYKGRASQRGRTELPVTSDKSVVENMLIQGYDLDHSGTLDSLVDSAFLCERQGRFAKAEGLYKKAISLCHHHFGEGHLSMAAALSGLAALYQSQNRYSEAESLLQHALQIRLQTLLANQSDIAENCYQLANVYRYQQQYDRAEPLFQVALTIFRQQLGSAHPTTRSVYDDLMQMLAVVIEAGQYHEITKVYPPLDLDNISDQYPWARPI